VRFEVGETLPLQAAFGGVPAGVRRLSVMLAHAGVFTDIPVVDGGRARAAHRSYQGRAGAAAS
jgi:hypothetical protein